MRKLTVRWIPVLVLWAISELAIAHEVIEVLSQRLNKPEAEVVAILNNCDHSQHNMTWCAVRDSLTADFELREKLDQLSRTKTAKCMSALRLDQTNWLKQRNEQCLAEADRQVGEGSMFPMVVNRCQARLSKMRSASFEHVVALICSKRK